MRTFEQRRKRAILHVLVASLATEGRIDAAKLHIAASRFAKELDERLVQNRFRALNLTHYEKPRPLFLEVDEMICDAVADGHLGLKDLGSDCYRVHADFIDLAESSSCLRSIELQLAFFAARRAANWIQQAA